MRSLPLALLLLVALACSALTSQTPFQDSSAAIILVKNFEPFPLVIAIRYDDHADRQLGIVPPGPAAAVFVLPSSGLGRLTQFAIVVTAPNLQEITSYIDRHPNVVNVHTVTIGNPPTAPPVSPPSVLHGRN